ncbi:hypothetical protein PHMEG_0008351 [Phytophthora megakarya]|uniref:Reverse transcriptase RNase H-like domain-containing protein n=1 Tax=Phytophthora megakarya TaxID=4795 RepID=A0A225WJE2_9STRA|nr:hypothetical protein PHMEG_0008351 [Phytophthora megakarya]
MWACVHLEYLLLRRRFIRLHCDHKTLIYTFDPSVELKRHIRGRLKVGLLLWLVCLT